MGTAWKIFAILFFTVHSWLDAELLVWLPARESKLTISLSADSESTLNKKKMVKSLLSAKLEFQVACINGQKTSAPPIDLSLLLTDFSFSFKDPLFSEQHEKPPKGFCLLQRVKGEKILLRFAAPSLGLVWMEGPSSLEEKDKEEILAFLEIPLYFALLPVGLELAPGAFFEFEVAQKGSQVSAFHSMRIDSVRENEIEAVFMKEIPHQTSTSVGSKESFEESGEGKIRWSPQNPLVFSLDYSSSMARDILLGDNEYNSLFKTKIRADSAPLHQ